MADPVAEKSTFLCMYMSNHPDTLVAYVKYWGKVSESVQSAKMTAIDTKGMNLSYKVKGAGDKEKEVRVPFDPPLAGYEEVKPRLLSMTADAQESLGMSTAPQITTFHLPSKALYQTGPLIFLLTYTTLAPLYTGPQWSVGHWLFNTFGGSMVFKGIWAFMGVVHGLEALYAYRLCSKHRTGFSVGSKYVVSVFLFGFPVLFGLRHKIQKARIDSIMKGN